MIFLFSYKIKTQRFWGQTHKIISYLQHYIQTLNHKYTKQIALDPHTSHVIYKTCWPTPTILYHTGRNHTDAMFWISKKSIFAKLSNKTYDMVIFSFMHSHILTWDYIIMLLENTQKWFLCVHTKAFINTEYVDFRSLSPK